MGFNFTKWVKDAVIQGYKTGEFSHPRIVTLTVDYVSKGILTEADAGQIAEACAPVIETEEWPEELEILNQFEEESE